MGAAAPAQALGNGLALTPQMGFNGASCPTSTATTAPGAICLMTILQSWSQGVEVWGRDGMRKLWSAANIKVYGGGVAEVEFLNELSSLVGDFELRTASTTHPGRGGGRSTSHATRRERILDVSDLGSLPKGRAVVFASGVPPVLAKAVPWMDGPDAAAVRASIEASTPRAPPLPPPPLPPRRPNLARRCRPTGTPPPRSRSRAGARGGSACSGRSESVSPRRSVSSTSCQVS